MLRFGAPAAVNMFTLVFQRTLMPCELVGGYQSFGKIILPQYSGIPMEAVCSEERLVPTVCSPAKHLSKMGKHEKR
jgi:hypothetical protein